MIEEYFEWMYRLVCDKQHTGRRSFRKLLLYLFHAEFQYVIDLDANRAEDAIDLRYRFGREHGYHDAKTNCELDNRPGSVLEVMVSMALFMEEHIMVNPQYGDRTAEWFWVMLRSLGLDHMSDSKYDQNTVRRTIDLFMDRRFSKSGLGSLFYVPDTNKDMRELEIVYQAYEYLNTLDE